MTRFSRVVLILRDLHLGVRFYRDGLGLQLETHTDSYARLVTKNGVPFELNAADMESQCSTGYSPLLTFEIEDMDQVVPRLIQLGASLDGAIRYEAYGKMASVRSPDGHMVGLFEKENLPGNGDRTVAAAKAAKAHLSMLDKQQRQPKTVEDKIMKDRIKK